MVNGKVSVWLCSHMFYRRLPRDEGAHSIRVTPENQDFSAKLLCPEVSDPDLLGILKRTYSFHVLLYSLANITGEHLIKHPFNSASMG